MAKVELKSLTKHFEERGGRLHTVVRGINLEIRDGEFMALVGPSGCGKSTTLRMIAGLEDVSGGQILLDGVDISRLEPRDRDIGMVFQNYALYPHMTVRENMGFGLKLRGVPPKEVSRRVDETAESLGLASLLERKPRALSGGQRQRVALGRAIVRRPRVFLFDEPLSNLDAQMRQTTRTELARLHSSLGVTMIYVTHDQVEAMTLGDRICVMNEGSIQQVDTPTNLYNLPANRFSAGFIGSPAMNFLEGTLVSTAGGVEFVEAQDGPDPLRVRLDQRLSELGASFIGRAVVLGLRPEAIGETTSDQPESEPSSVAVIDLVEPLGPETYLHFHTGKHRLIARVRPSPRHRAGRRLSLSFNLEGAHLFEPGSGDNLAKPRT